MNIKTLNINDIYSKFLLLNIKLDIKIFYYCNILISNLICKVLM